MRFRIVPARRISISIAVAPRLVRPKRPGGARSKAKPTDLPQCRRRLASDHRREEAGFAEQHLRRRHRPAGGRSDEAVALAEGVGRRVGRDDHEPVADISRAGTTRLGRQRQVRQFADRPRFLQRTANEPLGRRGAIPSQRVRLARQEERFRVNHGRRRVRRDHYQSPVGDGGVLRWSRNGLPQARISHRRRQVRSILSVSRKGHATSRRSWAVRHNRPQ